MQSRTETRRVRRKIRWGRLFLFLFVFVFMVVVLTGAAAYTYYSFLDEPVVVAEKPVDMVNKRINVLLLGLDEGETEIPGAPKRSDTIIVASIDPKTGTVNLFSIPRDTQVNIPGRKGYDKINHAYAYGGPALAERTVKEFLNIPIDYYIVINWQGFIKVVDILGGVDIYVENNMNYNDPYADLDIHLKKGYQHLNGAQAGEYVRFRSDELGDIGRVQRQQRFLKALNDELFNFGTVFKLPALTSTLKQHVSTDIPPMMMLKLANTVKGFNSAGLHTEMLPGNFATIDGLSYWVPDKGQIKQLVERTFSNSNPKSPRIN